MNLPFFLIPIRLYLVYFFSVNWQDHVLNNVIAMRVFMIGAVFNKIVTGIG